MLTYIKKRGYGFLNKIIDNLPVELHIPGYQYCGPGTKLKDRLNRGDPGINPLDVACKEHDIAYSQNTNLSERHAADKILIEKASKRVSAKDANLSEKVVALAVSKIINLKRKMGMSLGKNKNNKKIKKMKNKKKKNKKSGKGLRKKTTFRNIINSTKKLMNRKKDTINTAIAGARYAVKKAGGKKNILIPRIIPIPTKMGGILPIIPIFAGLSALGTIVGGVSSVVKAANAVNSIKKERVGSGAYFKPFSINIGDGVYLKPYRTGLGLYLSKN